jgi:hypothetical protein
MPPNTTFFIDMYITFGNGNIGLRGAEPDQA